MGAREWLTVGVFLMTVTLAAVGFLLKRFISRVDKHDEALYGEKGVFQLLQNYVKREDHDVANAELAAHMDKMRLEGIQREGRIIDAIERADDRATRDNVHLRSDVVKLHERIDRIRDSQRTEGRERG